MKRRHIIYLIILALLAPQVVSALPRDPSLFSSEHPQETFIEAHTIFAASNDAILSSKLIKGRQYRFAITGSYTTNSTTKGDAGFISTNNWGSCSQNGTGLVVDTTNWGSPGSGLNAGRCDRFSHKYSIAHTGGDTTVSFKIADADGSRSGNSGSLRVEIYLLALVTWTVSIDRPLGAPSGEVFKLDTKPYATDLKVDEVRAPLPETPPVQGPNVAGVRIRFVKNSPSCDPALREMVLTLTLSEQDTEFPTGQCFGDFTDSFEVSQTTGVTVWPGSGGGSDPLPFTGQTYTVIPAFEVPIVLPEIIPQGTKLNINFSWNADTSRMVRVASTTAGNEVWAPFGPSDAAWYAQNLSSLGGKIGVTVIDPNGKPQYGFTRDYPGMGQVIESLFSSKVAGK